MSPSCISSLAQEERSPLPPRAFIRMILMSLFVYYLWVSVCPTTSLFCPTKSCILWRRSCVFFTIIFLVHTIEPGREWSIRKWLFRESPEKAAPFYRNGQRGIKRAATSDRQCPKRSPWCSEHKIKLISWLFTEGKKASFSEKLQVDFIYNAATNCLSVWERDKEANGIEAWVIADRKCDLWTSVCVFSHCPFESLIYWLWYLGWMYSINEYS